MDIKQARKDIEFNEQDENRILSLLPFMKEHLGKIVDESSSILLKDQRVADLLRKANLKPNDAKLVWENLFKLVFSKPSADETIERLHKIGITHINKGVSEDFVIIGASLFMLKTLEHMKMNMDMDMMDIDHFLSVAKLFSLITFVVIVSYVEEGRRGILNSLGISDTLLDRLAKLGIS